MHANGIECPAGCFGEQGAAAVLGYTQVSWDNLSGKEKMPHVHNSFWAQMPEHEKAAARALGYTQKSWDDTNAKQPPANTKWWHELKACGKPP